MPDAAPFELDSEGVLVRGEICGSGPPLVLVHGWTLDRRIFTPQLPDFARHFRVITYDRRASGQSEAAPDLNGDVADLAAVIDRIAGEPAHLLGMSQGGRVALRHAVLRQESLRSMVLQGPALDQFAAPEPEHEKVPMEAFAALAREGRLEELHRRWLGHAMMSAGVESSVPKALLESIVRAYDGADLRRPSAEPSDFPRDMATELPRVNVPTLLITGALETSARRAHSDRIRELLPNCSEIVLPRSGHLSNLGEIDSYNRAVIEFCSAH